MTKQKFGRYIAFEEIGSGTFATVWRCQDPELGGDVAVKVLALHQALDPDTRDRFVREGQLLRRTDGQGRIVLVHDVGRTHDDRPYMVMQYADRGTLDDRLEDGPMGPDAVRQLLDALTPCLEVLSANGIVHRDLKPSNLLIAKTASTGRGGPLLGPDERLLLGDLGLAKPEQSNWEGTVIGGTPAYMPPEQARAGAVDRRADLYAAAAVVARVATGRPPPEPVAGVLPDLDMPPSYPPAFTAALQRSLAPTPDERPPSVKEWDAALRGGLDATAAVPPPPPPPAPEQEVASHLPSTSTRAPVTRGRTPLLIVGVVLAAVVVAGVFLVGTSRSSGALEASGEAMVGELLTISARDFDVSTWQVEPPAATSLTPTDGGGAEEFVIRPVFPRPLTVVATRADGREIRLDLLPRAHPDAPTILGPSSVEGGTIGSYSVAGSCEDARWSVETRSGLLLDEEGCTYEFTVRSPESGADSAVVFVLVAVDRDGVPVGNARRVQVT